MTNNGNTPPLRDQIAAQANRIRLLQRRNLALRRAIADALDLLAEALEQPHPAELLEQSRAVLADAQPQSDVKI